MKTYPVVFQQQFATFNGGDRAHFTRATVEQLVARQIVTVPTPLPPTAEPPDAEEIQTAAYEATQLGLDRP